MNTRRGLSIPIRLKRVILESRFRNYQIRISGPFKGPKSAGKWRRTRHLAVKITLTLQFFEFASGGLVNEPIQRSSFLKCVRF